MLAAASANINLSVLPGGHNVSHVTGGYLQGLLSVALSNHSTLDWSAPGSGLDVSRTARRRGGFLCFGSFFGFFCVLCIAAPNNMKEHERARAGGLFAHTRRNANIENRDKDCLQEQQGRLPTRHELRSSGQTPKQ